MPARCDKGQWRYRTVVRLADGSKTRISGTPSINTCQAAKAAERAHIVFALAATEKGAQAARKRLEALHERAARSRARLSAWTRAQAVRRSIRWTPEMDARLGTVPDKTLATELGLCEITVMRRRHALSMGTGKRALAEARAREHAAAVAARAAQRRERAEARAREHAAAVAARAIRQAENGRKRAEGELAVLIKKQSRDAKRDPGLISTREGRSRSLDRARGETAWTFHDFIPSQVPTPEDFVAAREEAIINGTAPWEREPPDLAASVLDSREHDRRRKALDLEVRTWGRRAVVAESVAEYQAQRRAEEAHDAE